MVVHLGRHSCSVGVSTDERTRCVRGVEGMSFGVKLTARASFQGVTCADCKAPVYEHHLNGEVFLLDVEPERYCRDHDPDTDADFLFLGYRVHRCGKRSE